VYLFMHILRTLDSSPLSLVWIVLLIDCIVNTDLKGPQKLWWILFIFLTQFFGALLYFFLGPAQIYRHIVNKMNQPYQSPDHPHSQRSGQQWYRHFSHNGYTEQATSPEARQQAPTYQEGYRAQESVTPPAVQEVGPSDALYEEPQATYPEMIQEQKQQ
jgi:hypothetical protein